MKRSLTVNSNYPPQGLISDGAVGALEMQFEDPDWTDNAFQQRIPLTINAGQVPTTQTDFPLLINDTYPDLIGEVEAEIRFAGSDNVQLPYEIEKFDNLTGELTAWVKKPTVNDGDFIAIYFDNPGAIDEQNPGVVWSDYNAVYHLNQTSFGASSTLDSTSHNLDGTPISMDATNQIAGQIDGSLDFDGTLESIELVDSTLLDPGTGAWTVSAWIRPDSAKRMDYVGKQRQAIPFDGWVSMLSNTASDRKLFCQYIDNGIMTVRGTFQLTLFQLHYVVCTYDGSDNASGVRMFVDGVEDVTNIELDTLTGGISTPGVILNIANQGDVSTSPFNWDGCIDEVNISANVKTPDFITTSFNNQDNPGTFYSTGAVESVPIGDVMEFETLGTMEFES